MVTVRQLLELMHEDDLVYIINNENEDEEYGGFVEACADVVPNAVLDSLVTEIHSTLTIEGCACSGIAIYREARK